MNRREFTAALARNVLAAAAVVFALSAISAYSTISRADDAPDTAPDTAPKKKTKKVKSAAVPNPNSDRSKSLSFEDNLVEGMNGNPLDSLENIAKDDKKNHGHLYRKRTDFRKEMKDTTQEGGFTP